MRNKILPAAMLMIVFLGPGWSSLPAGGLCVEGQWPYGISVSVVLGDDLAVVENGAALLVLDTSEPSSPQVVGEAVFEWDVDPLAISGDPYLYAVTKNEPDAIRIHVLDLSAPSQPVEIAAFDVAGTVYDLALAGDRLYVAGGDAGLRIIDISDLSAPVVLGSLAFDYRVESVAVSGTRAYVSDGALHVVDCTDASAPTVLGSFSDPWFGFSNLLTTGQLVVAVYTTGWEATGVMIFDVSDPTGPVPIGAISVSPFLARVKTAVAGSVLAVAHRSALKFFDIKAPSSPTAIGQLTVPGAVGGAALDGSNAYFTSTTDGMGVAEVSVTAPPVVVAWVDGPPAGNSTSLAVSGNLAYLGEVESTLRVFDVSEPERPVPLGAVTTPLSSISGITVAGNLLFVTGKGKTTPGALLVLDTSDPYTLPQVSLLGFAEMTGGVAVSGTIATVKEGYSGVVFVDVADPTAPVAVGRFDTDGIPSGVAASGDLVFINDYDWQQGGLHIVDVSEPTAPVEIGFAPSPHGDSQDLALSGSYVLVAARYDGLRVVDVSDPTAPVEVGSVATTSNTALVVADGKWAYVLDHGYPRYRLRLFDITNPPAPVEVAFVEPGALPQILAADGGNVFVTTPSAELTIMSPCAVVFTDGFESGNSSNWSATIP